MRKRPIVVNTKWEFLELWVSKLSLASQRHLKTNAQTPNAVQVSKPFQPDFIHGNITAARCFNSLDFTRNRTFQLWDIPFCKVTNDAKLPLLNFAACEILFGRKKHSAHAANLFKLFDDNRFLQRVIPVHIKLRSASTESVRSPTHFGLFRRKTQARIQDFGQGAQWSFDPKGGPMPKMSLKIAWKLHDF